MRTVWLSLAVAATILLLAQSALAQRGGWEWNRTAGAKIEGNFGYFNIQPSDYSSGVVYTDYSAFSPAFNQEFSGSYTTAYGSYGQGFDPCWPNLNRNFQQGSLQPQPDVPLQSGFQQQGQMTPLPIHTGERVQVAAPNAQLMLGSQALASLNRGQMLRVLNMQGPWVGATADVNGDAISGWVHISHLAPVSTADTRVR